MRNLILLTILIGQSLKLLAQGTSFTYQGQIKDGGGAAGGLYDLRFTLHDLVSGGGIIGGPLTNEATSVSNGLFTVTLDFGAGVFTGAERWLEIAVRTNGGGAFSALNPRQPITATPYAIMAGGASNLLGTVPAGGLSGTYSGAVTFAHPASVFTGAFTGNGAGLTNLNFWRTFGNSGTTAGIHFVGTSDHEPLEFKVNGDRALRLEPGDAGNPPNVLGGRSTTAAAGTFSVTIGGGYYNHADTSDVTIGGGTFNHIGVSSSFATISGGIQNRIKDSAPGVVVGGSVIGGGRHNEVGYNSSLSVIGGGATNSIGTNSPGATIAGGAVNLIGTNASFSVISGGTSNQIRNFTDLAVVGGGEGNSVDSDLATIGGGYHNHIDSPSAGSVIGGGSNNFIWESVGAGTIAGGTDNTLETFARYSAIGGGRQNVVQGSAEAATIAGGSENTVGFADFAVIGGGSRNQAGSQYATIAGGLENWVIFASESATVSGGRQNVIHTNSGGATVSGGQFGTIYANSAFATLGGGYANSIGTNSGGSTLGGGQNNHVASDTTYASLGGGFLNDIGPSAHYGTIGGGTENDIGAGSWYCTIGGGTGNQVLDYSHRSVIAGGGNNTITTASYASLGGGFDNEVNAGAAYGTVGGGYQNSVGAAAQFATIPGGANNAANGDFAFAAGRRARADHVGAFVWGDGTDATVVSATNNSVTFRAEGGYRLFTAGDTNAGASLASGGTAWAVISDRNVKKDFSTVDSGAVLEKLAALPITQWRYRWESPESPLHLGPMAQDFKAAFYPGADDKCITTQEADGVALAAIQGLNRKLEEKKAELAALQIRSQSLERRLERLEKLLSSPAR